MTKFILDYSTWRCGVDGPNKLGEGDTSLLNYEGFMCCLGQAALQFKKELTKEEILNTGGPDDLYEEVPFLNTERYGDYRNTALASECIRINDDEDTTPQEKIELLKERFAKEGIEMEVINMPEIN